jgi:2,4-dienoyl-CoA reductase-like NADH-dependent reductase (Old Yellow Enzyme family)
MELANSILMAPNPSSSASTGIPEPTYAANYPRQAEGDVALILSEGTVILG